MNKNKVNRYFNYIAVLVSVGILIACFIIYNGTYKKFGKIGGEVITIGLFSDSYWEVQNGYSYRILEDAIKVFEEQNPGVKVKYETGILKEDYSEWLSEKLLSEDAPDLFYVLADDFNNLAEIGALKDLTSLIEKDDDFHKEEFYSSAYEYGQYNNIQYSLPYECAPKLMFVNKTILNKEGLKIPEEDWSWDDFYEICKQVTKDTDGDNIDDQFGVVGYTWEEAFESNGIKLFNKQGTECYLTGSNVEDALSFIEKIGKLNGGYNVTGKDFDLGNVAFQPMLFSEYRAYKPYPLSVKKYSGFEWECIPMPAGPKGDNISKLDTLLIAINENSSNARRAWDFMKILTCNPKIQSEIFDYSEGVSVLKEVTEADQTLQQLIGSTEDNNGMNLSVLSDAVENAVTIPRFRNYDEARDEVDRAINAIIDGNYNISMGQIIWKRRINKYLKNNKG